MARGHLNPIKIKSLIELTFADKKEYLNNYRWSSYHGYINKSKSEKIINYNYLSMMERKTENSNRNAYRKYIEEMISENDYFCRLVVSASRYAIGSDEFVEIIESNVTKNHSLEYGVGKDLFLPEEHNVSIKNVEYEASKELKISVDDLHTPRKRAGYLPRIVIEMCCQLCGKSQREIAEYFGYKHESSVGKQRQIIQALLNNDDSLQKVFSKLKIKIEAKYRKQ